MALPKPIFFAYTPASATAELHGPVLDDIPACAIHTNLKGDPDVDLCG
ncbi:MAG: hypothetical protein AAFY77_03565 [Pseudomonadota bacterium]